MSVGRTKLGEMHTLMDLLMFAGRKGSWGMGG